MAPKQKTKKKNFNDNEREVLLSEVEARKYVLFKSVSTGVTGTGKKETWDAVTQAVNVVSPEIRTVAEVKKSGLTWSSRPKEEFQSTEEKRHGWRAGATWSVCLRWKNGCNYRTVKLERHYRKEWGESDLIQEQLQHGNMLKSKSLF